MKVLVVGGAGYIGSHMVKLLLEAGHETSTLDSLVTGHRDAVVGGELFKVDLGDVEALARVFESRPFDAVMHFASFIQVGESVRKPGLYYRNNFANTLNLLDAMLLAGVKRFIFSSTAAIFGSIGERHEPETHLIPLLLQAACGRRESVSLFGRDYDTPDGTCIRDYIHVVDLCQAHLLALHWLMDGGHSAAFNLGNGNGFSVLEVIRAVELVTRRNLNVVDAPRRDGDPARLVADSRLIRQTLGWTPAYAQLETIVAHGWEWEQKRA